MIHMPSCTGKNTNVDAQHAQMNKGKTEVAIIIGADPATVFSAIAPVPEGLDKYCLQELQENLE